MVEDYGGGTASGRPVKAVQVGGELRWPRIRGLDLDFNVKPFARYSDHPTASLLSA